MTQPDLQIYPDEQRKIQLALAKLQNFEFSKGDEHDRKLFEMAATEEFATIGFDVCVTWQQVHRKSVLRDTRTGVWLPQVEVIGRSRPEEETDHDRVKWGVVKGLADGQPGYVRADGSKHEDPKSKLILP